MDRRKTIKFLFILITAATISNCSDGDHNINYASIVLKLEGVMERKAEKKLSSLISNIDYVLLSNDRDGLIGKAGKIILTDKNFIISDLSVGHIGVFVFDKKGNFIRKIGAKGKGPGEYFQMADFTFNKDNGSLYILSNTNKNLLAFDINGNIRKNITSNGLAVSIKYFDGALYSHIPSNIAFYRKAEDTLYQLIVRDTFGKIVSKYHPMNPAKKNFLNPFIEMASFSECEGHLYYHTDKEYFVYELKDYKMLLAYHFNFGNYAFPADFEWSYENTREAYTLNKVMLDKVLLAKNNMFINYRMKQKRGMILCNLDNNEIINVGSNENYGFIDDIDGLGHFSDFFSQDSILLRAISADEFLAVKENSYGFSSRIKVLRNEVKEEDNLIIQVLTLK